MKWANVQLRGIMARNDLSEYVSIPTGCRWSDLRGNNCVAGTGPALLLMAGPWLRPYPCALMAGPWANAWPFNTYIGLAVSRIG